MTRDERRYFGNRRPSPERLLQYRQLNNLLRENLHNLRVRTGWYNRRSARERGFRNRINRQQIQRFRDEGYGDLIDKIERQRRRRKGLE